MSFETLIAKKHLFHTRKAGFVSLVSTLCVLGVALGVCALIVVLAIMSGFDRDYKQIFVNIQPHLRIDRFDGIENPQVEIEKIRNLKITDLETVASFIEGEAILQSESNTAGVVVKGMDAVNENLSIYEQHMESGNLDFADKVTTESKRWLLFFHKTRERREGSVMIGEVLAARLHVRVGDNVTLISPPQRVTNRLSLLRAETRTFIVRGIFRVGMNDFDSQLALISMPQAQTMFHLNQKASGLVLRFKNVDNAEKWKIFLRGQFTSDYWFRTWYDMNYSFFRALKVEKSLLNIVLAFIILVAAFNIASILIMVVMEKTKDIGILRALGATKASIRRIFLIEGFSVGFSGVLVGALLGFLTVWNRNGISDFLKNSFGLEIFPSDIYFLSSIPAEINPQDVILVVSFALLASVLAGLYPAHRAAALNPVEALRYE